MPALGIPTYFHGWLQETGGDGAISVFDDGRATINASAGSVAYLYTSAQLFPGESVEFSCNVYAATGKAQVAIRAFTSGSGLGDTNDVDALAGDQDNQAISVKYTAPLTSNECVLVYFKVGVPTDVSGSVTVMCPRAQISRAFIGTLRTTASALLELNGGSVSINKSYLRTGILEVNLVDSGDGSIFYIEVVMDKIVPAGKAGLSLYPQVWTDQWLSVSTTTNQHQICVVSYNALSNRVLLGFKNSVTGAKFDARAIYQCNIQFNANII